MVNFIVGFISTVLGTCIGYILLRGLKQREMSLMVLLCGFLTITYSFSSFMIPNIKRAEQKAIEAREDFKQFNNTLDKLGTGVDRITGAKQDYDKTKGAVDKWVERTKVPYLDKIDKAIEDGFNKLTGGE